MPRLLGRVPTPEARRAKVLRLAHYLDYSALPTPPATNDWGDEVTSWPMFGNSKAGCCTFAGLGHGVCTWVNETTGKMPTLKDSDILGGYSALTGYNPNTGANDNGANMLDVLGYWRKNGVGGYKVDGWVGIDPTDLRECYVTCWLLGGIYTGANLPLAANTDGDWTDPPNLVGRWAPGSWGGHAFWTKAFGPKGFGNVTWAKKKNITNKWWTSYVEEAYGVLSGNWIEKVSQKAPSGFDYKTLANDMADIGGQPHPFPDTPPPEPTPPPVSTIPITLTLAGTTYAGTVSAAAKVDRDPATLC